MRGAILGVHDGRGTLLSADDRRLEFPMTEWRSGGAPVAGQVVDFIEEGGQARAVFAVPGATLRPMGNSGSFVLGAIAVGCLALGFVIPMLPTIAAFVLGVIGAAQARAEGDDTALVLSRIAWIGALVLMALSILAIIAAIVFIGAFGLATFWELGPHDF